MTPPDDQTRGFFLPGPGVKLNQYVLGERLGAGGMGEVFLAEDTSLGRKVALKFLPPQMAQDAEFRTRFLREARAAASLNHPNVVHVYEVGEHQGRPFFAMEFAAGESLRDLLARSDVTLSRALELALQIGEGLREAHAAGIVHRDLKPANVILDAKGHAKLLDFGLAVLEGGDRVTQVGTTLGTVGYMAPEQVRGEEVDPRADLFSFGVVLYELIAGQAPFRRDNESATLQAILHENPEPLARYRRDVPEGLQRLVDKLLDKNRETRCQSAADLVADLKRERAALEGTTGMTASRAAAAGTAATLSAASRGPGGSPGPGGRGRPWPVLVGLLAVAAVAALLLLKPWAGRDAGPAPVEAAENRLIVLYFENVPEPEDPRRIGEILSSLLITDLSESQYLQVVSTQRLYDLLDQLGHAGEKRVPPGLASQLAEKAGARWMLTGSVLQSEPRLVVTSELVDRTSGDVVASQRVTGQAGEDVFAVVDRLTVALKTDLALPAAATDEPDRPVADVTTHSPEAYRAYLLGVEAGDNLLVVEAAQHFRRAVELDSTFVMANLKLAQMLGNTPEGEVVLDRAMRHKDQAAWRERKLVEAFYAFTRDRMGEAVATLNELVERFPEEREVWIALGFAERESGNYEKSVEAYERVVTLNPNDGPAWNQLAYSYLRGDDLENAMRAADRYLELDPDQPNPYDTRGDVLAESGRLREALASYIRANELKPGFHPGAPFKIGGTHMFLGDSTAARQVFQKLAASEDPFQRSRGRTALATVESWFGRMERARSLLRDGIAADELGGETESTSDKRMALATLLELAGRYEEALAVLTKVEASLDPDQGGSDLVFAMEIRVRTLLEMGQLQEAKAVLEKMEADFGERAGTDIPGTLAFVRSELVHAEGNLPQALALAEESQEAFGDVLSSWHLARLYLEAGRADRAVEVLEKVLQVYSEERAYLAPYNALCYYELGRAYEASGWEEKAVKAYGDFLNQWKDGDPDLPYVNEARQRVRVLQTNP